MPLGLVLYGGMAFWWLGWDGLSVGLVGLFGLSVGLRVLRWCCLVCFLGFVLGRVSGVAGFALFAAGWLWIVTLCWAGDCY